MQHFVKIGDDAFESGFHTGHISDQQQGAAEAIQKADFHGAGLGGDVCGNDHAFSRGDGQDAQSVAYAVIQPQLEINSPVRAGDDMGKRDLFAGNVFLDNALFRFVSDSAHVSVRKP